MTPNQVAPLCEQAAREMAERGIAVDVERLHRDAPENANARFLLEHVQSDGRVHPRWAVGHTKLGRWIASNPNILNLRGIDRWLDGYAFVGAYTQEFAIAAHLARQEDLIEANRAGVDLHSIVARKLNLSREMARRVTLNTIYGVDPDPSWLAAFPAIAQHVEKTRENAARLGYVVSALLDHRVEDVKNGPIELLSATSADVVKCAVAECQDEGTPLAGVLFDQLIVPVEFKERAALAFKRAGVPYDLQIVGLDREPARIAS